jgi:hypothetical protein
MRRLSTLLLGGVAGMAVMLPLTATAAPAHQAAPAASSTGYTGPFVTMKVPAPCAFPQNNLRYYNDPAPAGTQFLRSGAHGHGGYLRCIYFAVSGPLTGTDHHYGKWLIFTADGRGLLIGPNGVEATYVNCALPGYRFPFPVGNGQPNDCGESWVSSDGDTWVYQDNTAGDLGKPMFPAVLP